VTVLISCDTNIFLYHLNANCVEHQAAKKFVEEQANNHEFAVCELVLAELYVLLRNPAVSDSPLSSKAAVQIVQHLRANPAWRVIDYPGNLMDEVWRMLQDGKLSRCGIFDLRLALTLRHHGVKVLATRNIKHFQGLGFEEIINPIDG
jgi:uncharacterized protein